MSRITELLRRVEKDNPGLAADLRDEVDLLAQRRAFGLNFERHVPETVELSHRKVRRGDKVRFLAPRKKGDKDIDRRLWLVTGVSGRGEKREASLTEWRSTDTPEEATRLVEDLVVVAEFRDPIYPGLRSKGKVERGDGRPHHLVINGENYHALDTLLFAYEARVDCIYIDPPYNTRDKDWKYNNDYVDSDDAYKHSKWLAMMERRLKLAKKLINPDKSVLIVTIDEKEYLRLGLLLEQTFPEADIQMVSTVINRKGNPRRGEFSRCEEYLLFLRFGDAAILPWGSDMLTDEPDTPKKGRVRWKSLLRLASTGQTSGRFNLFYPLYFEEGTRRFLRTGDPLPDGVDIDTVPTPEGEGVLWPISKDGTDGRWSIGVDKFNDYLRRGYVRFGQANGGGRTPYYLMSGQIEAIESGDLVVTGHDADGAVVLQQAMPRKQPMSIWNQQSHSTSGHGTTMLRDLLPGRRFPYPKSLYAVEDALRFAVGDKPEAVVLDFFAGSGTTGHAVMRLNRQDGGSRQSILVTNNEVSADEAESLRADGLRPGDPEWESLGIFEYITKPRMLAATTGQTHEGKPVSGDYRFTDKFAMSEGFEENVEFFELSYEDPEQVRLDMAFTAVAPLLWIRAGSQGRRIDERSSTYDMTDEYGILFNLDSANEFLMEAKKRSDLRIAYVVTDEEKQYQLVASRLPAEMEVIQLYEAYLTTFEISSARDSR